MFDYFVFGGYLHSSQVVIRSTKKCELCVNVHKMLWLAFCAWRAKDLLHCFIFFLGVSTKILPYRVRLLIGRNT